MAEKGVSTWTHGVIRALRRALGHTLIVVLALSVVAAALVALPDPAAVGQVEELCDSGEHFRVVTIDAVLRSGEQFAEGPFPLDLPAGTYTIRLVSSDPDHPNPPVPQTGEAWNIELRDASGVEIYRSPSTPDLPDSVPEASYVVADAADIGAQATALVAHHADPEPSTVAAQINSVVAECAVFDLVQPPAVGIAVTADTASVTVGAGTNTGFGVEVENVGDASVTGLTTTPAICDDDPAIELAPGDTTTIRCTVTTDQAPEASVTVVGTSAGESVEGRAEIEVLVAGLVADLDASATADSGRATLNGTVENSGTATLTDLEVGPTELPDGVADEGCTTGQGTLAPGDETAVTCALSGLTNAGDSLAVEYVATAVSDDSSAVSVTGSSTSVITVGPPPLIELDIELAVSTQSLSADIGGIAGFDIVVTNQGPGAAETVSVAVDLPDNVVLDSAGARDGDTFTGDIWVLNGLDAGASATASYTVAATAAGSGTVVAEVIAITGGTDTDSQPGDGTGDDHATATITVEDTPPRPTRGNIQGAVFIDADGDGAFDANETAVSGVRVVVIGETIATTTSGGTYSASVPAGPHVVAIDTATLPAGVRATRVSATVTVRAGAASIVNFALDAEPGDYGISVTPASSELEMGETTELEIAVTGPNAGEVLIVDLEAVSDEAPAPLSLERSQVEVAVGGSSFVQVTGVAPGPGTITATLRGAGDPSPSATATITVADGLAANTIQGSVYVDLNGNGRQDGAERRVDPSRDIAISIEYEALDAPSVSGGGLFGGIAVRFQTVEQSFVQVVDGRFRVDLDRPGTYTLRVFEGGAEVPGANPGTHVFAVSALGQAFSANFGVPGGGAGITGVVFRDGPGEFENGVRDPDEPGIGGVGVRIQGVGRDEVVLTNTDGVYRFTADEGTYTISIDERILGPIELTPGASETIAVTLDADGSVEGVDFPVISAPLGVVTGTVWCDADNDGKRHPLEKEVPGVPILLQDAPENPTVVYQRTVTQSGGGYQFDGLLPATYWIAVDLADLALTVAKGPDAQRVGVVIGEPNVRSFNVCQSDQLIGGFVFRDSNNDGKRGTNEPGIEGISVTLDGPVTDEAVTDGDGGFFFPTADPTDVAGTGSALPAGRYTVSVSEDLDDDGASLGVTTQRTVTVNLTPGSVSEVSIAFGYGVPGRSYRSWLIAVLIAVGIFAWLWTRRQPAPVAPVPIRKPIGERTIRPDESVPTPYRGPRPFRPVDAPVFFGREREIRSLESMTYANRILVVYGPSGAGKTSLLNAGYIPGLDPADFEVLQPNARFQLGPQRPEDWIGNVFAHAVLSYLSGTASPSAASLAEYLQQRPSIVDEHGQPAARVIVVDEFQEMFRLYKDRWRDRQAFFDQIGAALESDPLVRFVFCIDEDEMGELEPFIEQFGPHIVSEFRVEQPAATDAAAAVTGPAEAGGRAIGDDVAARLVENARTIRAEYGGYSIEVVRDQVDPMALQLGAEATWRNAGDGEITADDVWSWDDGDAALTALYESTVSMLGPGDGERMLREWCERALISPSGSREAVAAPESRMMHRDGRLTMDVHESVAGLPAAVFEALLEREFLLVAERGDLRWVELAHDRFIDIIRESNREWRLRSVVDTSAGLLSAAARIWDRHGRDAEGLLTGQSLEFAREWAAAYAERIGNIEQEYLTASVAAAESQVTTSPDPTSP
jgi:hypothetical protein